MSVTPSLDGMPEPDADDSGATVAMVKELPNGVLITMSDGRDIRVHPGDNIDIRPITRDTQLVTEGSPTPRNFRDVHNEGALPDIVQALLAPRPQTLAPAEAPTPAAPPPPPPTPMAPEAGPMLPDMAAALGGAPPPTGATPQMGMGMLQAPPPPGSAPLGGGAPSAAGPPGRLTMPPMPPDYPTLPGMPGG